MSYLEPVSNDLVRKARNAPYLERVDEQQLAMRWKYEKDETALHALTQSHMRLVMAIAARFRNYGLPVSDLVQEGYIGLLEAAARFEPEREVRFSTYATWWIRASIQDYILRNWSIVRGGTSSAQKSLFFNLRRLRAKLSRLSPNESSHQMFQDIALALGVSLSDVEAMNARLSGPDASLNAPVGDSDEAGAERGDFLIDNAPSPVEVTTESIDSERRLDWLRNALGTLAPRELRIVKARRLAEEPATLEQLGEELGISKERVRQLEARALEKLRVTMTASHGEALVPA